MQSYISYSENLFFVQKEVSADNKEKWKRITERENEKRLQQKKFDQMKRKLYKDK